MKKYRCGWNSSTNHLHGLYICMHPCGWENHKCIWMKKLCCGRNSSTSHPHGLTFYASMCMRELQTHMDEEISFWMKIDESSTWHNICTHPCGWENHKSIWLKKQHCGRNSSTNHRHGVTLVCIHVDERITNPHRWRNSVVDEIVRRIIHMELHFYASMWMRDSQTHMDEEY
jgi:hypothetical protein